MNELDRVEPTHCSMAAEAVAEALPVCIAPEARICETGVERRLLPAFFVVGPPRTGSSWLYEVLKSHAALPSPSKETRFFDTHFDRGLKWYLAHYRHCGGERRVGEVAPTYFSSDLARERISQTVPDAKIICVFRNPVERIVSLYRLKRAYGLIPWAFEEAMERDPELTETSRYVATLQLWQRSFGAENVLVGIYDDLRENPQTFAEGIADFAGIRRFRLERSQFGAVHDSEQMTNPKSYYRTRSATIMADWLKARRLDQIVAAFKRSPLSKCVLGGGRPFLPIQVETIARLYEKFRPEVQKLEELLQRDLSQWKFHGASEGRGSSATEGLLDIRTKRV